MSIQKTELRWTNEEARKLHVQLLKTIEKKNAEIAPKVDRLVAAGRAEAAAKLLDDHRWAMQPLVDQAARLVSTFTVPFMIVTSEDASEDVERGQ